MGAIASIFNTFTRTGALDGYTGRRAPIPPPARMHARTVRAARRLGGAMAETAWTTRCIICDMPGEVLCGDCRLHLPYIDRNLACPRCGSPHGMRQCMDCNTFSLAEVGRSEPPFERCISAIEHRGAARALVTGFKDAGELRLADEIAGILADALPRSWLGGGCALACIPADARARRRRGFDHMQLVGQALAARTGLPLVPLLEKHPVADQRGLGRRERFANLAGAIRVAGEGARPPGAVLLVDDVYTTGATLFAASDALHGAGVEHVRCATFARVA